MAWRTIVDHRDSEPVTELRSSFAAGALTLLDSGRIFAERAAGELDDEGLDAWVRRWADHMFHAGRAAVEVMGEEHLPEGRCVLMSNHTSLMDPAAAVLAFPRPLSFVAKQELRAIPLFGGAMKHLGVVFVNLREPRQAVEQLTAARDELPRDRAIWIAVEGGRSRDGTLRRFKKGPFHLALQWQVPIVPTFIGGARDILPPDAWSMTSGQRCRVAYGAPIATAGRDVSDLKGLMDQTRAAIEELAPLCAGGGLDAAAKPRGAGRRMDGQPLEPGGVRCPTVPSTT